MRCGNDTRQDFTSLILSFLTCPAFCLHCLEGPILNQNILIQDASRGNSIRYHLATCLCKSRRSSHLLLQRAPPLIPTAHQHARPRNNDRSININVFQGHNEALALVSGPVSANEPPAGNSSVASNGQTSKQEALQRAKELVQLHYEVKSRHADGEVDEELRQAREDVYRVLRELA